MTFYNPNSPPPPEFLAVSQPQFLTNFQELYDAFLVNHVPLNASSNAGNHNVIQFIEQENDPQTNVDEWNTYAKDIEGQTDQLFIRPQGNAEAIQYSNYQIYSILPTATQTSFFTFLPGNILVYFGTFTATLTSTPSFILKLTPPIAKTIVTVSMCLSGISPRSKPYVTLNTLPNGLIPSMNVGAPGLGGGITNGIYFYMVLANI